MIFGCFFLLSVAHDVVNSKVKLKTCSHVATRFLIILGELFLLMLLECEKLHQPKIKGNMRKMIGF